VRGEDRTTHGAPWVAPFREPGQLHLVLSPPPSRPSAFTRSGLDREFDAYDHMYM